MSRNPCAVRPRCALPATMSSPAWRLELPRRCCPPTIAHPGGPNRAISNSRLVPFDRPMPVPREVHPASRGVHRDGYRHPEQEGVGTGIAYRGDDRSGSRFREAYLRGPRKPASRAVSPAFRFPSPARARAAIIRSPSPRPLPPRDRLGRAQARAPGELEDSVWDHLAGSVIAPFEAGAHRRIAVKVIDDWGNELMAVKHRERPNSGRHWRASLWQNVLRYSKGSCGAPRMQT